MKKTQYLAGIVAVSMMLMGAGYAAWTQSVTVTHQTDLGELNVGFTPTKPVDNDGDYFKVNAKSVGDDKVQVTLTDFYPGAEQSYTFGMENKGTIGAKFDLDVAYNYNGQDLDASTLTEASYVITVMEKDKAPKILESMSESQFINYVNGLKDVAPGTKYIVDVKVACKDLGNEFEKASEKITYTLNISQFNK